MKRFIIPLATVGAISVATFIVTFLTGQQCPQGFTLSGGKCVAQTTALQSGANIAIGPGNSTINGTMNIRDATPSTGATVVNIGLGASQTALSATLVNAGNTAFTEQNLLIDSGTTNAIAGNIPGLTIGGGTCVTVVLTHTLQAGANTFSLNGGPAVPIVSHFNGATIARGYASNGYIQLCNVGTNTAWFDMSQ